MIPNPFLRTPQQGFFPQQPEEDIQSQIARLMAMRGMPQVPLMFGAAQAPIGGAAVQNANAMSMSGSQAAPMASPPAQHPMARMLQGVPNALEGMGAGFNGMVRSLAGLPAQPAAARPMQPLPALNAATPTGMPALAAGASAPAARDPAARLGRQPQEGARAITDIDASPFAPLDPTMANGQPDGLDASPLAQFDKRPVPLLERIGGAFSQLTETNPETGLSTMEAMAPWLNMISNNEAKWLDDPSAGKGGFTGFTADITANAKLARDRKLQDEQLGMVREEFGWNRDRASRETEAYKREAETLKSFDTWIASLPQDEAARLKLLGPQAAVAEYNRRRDSFIQAGEGKVYNPITGELRVYDPAAVSRADRESNARIAAAYRTGEGPRLSTLQRLNIAGRMNNEMAKIQATTQQLASALPYAQATLSSWQRGVKKPEGFDPQTFANQDAQLTFIVSKAIQGAGVLTESDIRILSAANLPTSTESLQKWLTGRGGQIGDVQRYALSQILVDRIGAVEDTLREEFQNAQSELGAANLNPEDIGVRAPAFLIPRDGERAFGGDQSRGMVYVPTDAVASLRLNPTPERQRRFEEAFDLPAGSAERYIRGRDGMISGGRKTATNARVGGTFTPGQ